MEEEPRLFPCPDTDSASFVAMLLLLSTHSRLGETEVNIK